MMRRIGILAVVALALTGCPKKKTPPTTANNAGTVAAATPEATPSTIANGEEVRKGLPDVKTRTLATIYFDLDSSTLTDASKATLQQNFEILRDNVDVKVRLEGNADERGSTQYNAALGERRAVSVKKFLETLGIAGTRLTTVSYGEEKPINPGHDESAWSQNRRVELTVVVGNDRVGSSR